MRSISIGQFNQKIAQSRPFNRFGGVLRETSGCRVPLTFSHYICGERDHWDMGKAVPSLPGADLSTGFIPIFVGHLNVALKMKVRTEKFREQ